MIGFNFIHAKNKRLRYTSPPTWLLLMLLLTACSHSDRHLVSVKNDQPVDLSRLEEVRRHLNGFWVLEDAKDEFWKENILWWRFHEVEPRAGRVSPLKVEPCAGRYAFVSAIKPTRL